jgi:ribosomal protein S18 acetylase RimI-like enzyme
MLDQAADAIGRTFRGAVQTGAYRYLGRRDGHEFGYIDCGTFNRHTVYAGEGPDGPIITESIDVATGAIAFAVDPEQRGRGLGRAMIAALMRHPDLEPVELFEAGVEPDNAASRRCLEAAGFRIQSEQPDFEGMLYYLAWSSDLDPPRRPPSQNESCGSRQRGGSSSASRTH